MSITGWAVRGPETDVCHPMCVIEIVPNKALSLSLSPVGDREREREREREIYSTDVALPCETERRVRSSLEPFRSGRPLADGLWSHFAVDVR